MKTSDTALLKRRIFLVSLVLLIILSAVLVFYFRDKSVPGGATVKAEAAQRLDVGSHPQFGICGDYVAASSSTGLALFHDSGRLIESIDFHMDKPSLSSSNGLAAAWDSGGREISLLYSDGSSKQLSTDGRISSVSVFDNGFLAVIASEPSYKGAVTVYNKDLTPIYKWYSASGYPLTTAISPSGKQMAVICTTSSGGSVTMLALDSETALGTFLLEGSFITDARFIDDRELCAVAENEVIFLDSKGAGIGSVPFGDMKLRHCTFGDDFVFLCLSDTVSENSRLLTVGSGARILGDKTAAGTIISASARGKSIATSSGSSVTLFSGSLRELKIEDYNSEIISLLLTRRGDALIILYNKEIKLLRS